MGFAHGKLWSWLFCYVCHTTFLVASLRCYYGSCPAGLPQSRRVSGGFKWWYGLIIAVGVAVILLLVSVGAFVWLARRRKRRKASVSQSLGSSKSPNSQVQLHLHSLPPCAWIPNLWQTTVPVICSELSRQAADNSSCRETPIDVLALDSSDDLAVQCSFWAAKTIKVSPFHAAFCHQICRQCQPDWRILGVNILVTLLIDKFLQAGVPTDTVSVRSLNSTHLNGTSHTHVTADSVSAGATVSAIPRQSSKVSWISNTYSQDFHVVGESLIRHTIMTPALVKQLVCIYRKHIEHNWWQLVTSGMGRDD